MNALRLFILIACFTAAPAFAADWPQWRGPNRDGHSADTGLLKEWPTEGPKLLWTFEKTGVGYSAPSIVGDRLFILGSDDDKEGKKEFALCLSVKEGKELWRTPIPTGEGKYSYGWGSGPRSSPTVDGGQVYCLGATATWFASNVNRANRFGEPTSAKLSGAASPAGATANHPSSTAIPSSAPPAGTRDVSPRWTRRAAR